MNEMEIRYEDLFMALSAARTEGSELPLKLIAKALHAVFFKEEWDAIVEEIKNFNS
jgi:hypothetical protein